MKKALNEDLIRLVVAQIEDTPQHWSQESWVQHNCNTRFCFAGWAVFMSDLVDGSGKPTDKGMETIAQMQTDAIKSDTYMPYPNTPYYSYTDEDGNESWYFPYSIVARNLLGLDDAQTDILFCGHVASRYDKRKERWVEDVELLKKAITRETGIEFS